MCGCVDGYVESDVDGCVVGCVELVTWRVDVAVDVESWVPGYVDSHVTGCVESGGVPRNLI